MARIQYEVVPALLGWRITKNGKRMAWFLRKLDAMDRVIEHANHRLLTYGEVSEMIEKGRNGRILDKSTYGRDPARTKG
jgi:hypothetical protein